MNQTSTLTILLKAFIKKLMREPSLIFKPQYLFSRFKKYFQHTDYSAWIERQQPTSEQIAALTQNPGFSYRPSISAVLLESTDNSVTRKSLESQAYFVREILQLSSSDLGGEGFKETIEKSAGEFLLFLREGDLLYPHTLYQMVTQLDSEADKQIDIIFTDHDYYSGTKRLNPFFKPGWSPDLFLVNNYLKRACLIRKTALLEVLGSYRNTNPDAALYQLCLKISENGKVAHCPGALFSFPQADDNHEVPEENEIRSGTLVRRGDNATVAANKYSVPTTVRNLVKEPLVSIIIPTCFKKDFIIDCLNSIDKLSTYKNYEIIVLDNSRQGSEYGKRKLENYECKVIYLDQPFNWAQFNNIGTWHASGDVFLFFNDDTEVITGDWLERMASQALRREIGVAGPMLLFPDGLVQHAGMFLVDNNAGVRHCFTHLPEDFTGYHGILHYQRNVIAMSGACQMVTRDKFEQINGFDERFSVGSNDVDFCLRLWEKGYNNLYLPEVRIIHKEKASRASLSEEDNTREFWERWGHLLAQGDPFYNKYLSQEHSDFRLRL